MMLFRIFIALVICTTAALAFHDNTFAVFELSEELQVRVFNLWELLQQLANYIEIMGDFDVIY